MSLVHPLSLMHWKVKATLKKNHLFICTCGDLNHSTFPQSCTICGRVFIPVLKLESQRNFRSRVSWMKFHCLSWWHLVHSWRWKITLTERGGDISFRVRVNHSQTSRQKSQIVMQINIEPDGGKLQLLHTDFTFCFTTIFFLFESEMLLHFCLQLISFIVL